jgi:hypothetical protein
MAIYVSASESCNLLISKWCPELKVSSLIFPLLIFEAPFKTTTAFQSKMSEKTDNINEEPSATAAVAPSEKQKSDVIIKSSAFIPGEPPVPIYSIIQSQSSQVRLAWYWLIGTVIFCSWTTSFAYTVFISNQPLPRAYDWGWSPALTTQIVNVASHVAVIFTGGLVSAVLNALSWSLASRQKGTTMGTFLAVQNNTSLMDVGRLFMIPGSQWIWCILRYGDPTFCKLG